MLSVSDLTVKVIKFTRGITEIAIGPLGKLIPDVSKAQHYLFNF